MRYINEAGQTIDESEADLSKGTLVIVQAIREDAEPIDDVTKFAYTFEDYEEVYMYILNREENTSLTQEERIAELEEALELLLSGVTE